jgi:hypothetical protein
MRAAAPYWRCRLAFTGKKRWARIIPGRRIGYPRMEFRLHNIMKIAVRLGPAAWM